MKAYSPIIQHGSKHIYKYKCINVLLKKCWKQVSWAEVRSDTSLWLKLTFLQLIFFFLQSYLWQNPTRDNILTRSFLLECYVHKKMPSPLISELPLQVWLPRQNTDRVQPSPVSYPGRYTHVHNTCHADGVMSTDRITVYVKKEKKNKRKVVLGGTSLHVISGNFV